MSYGTDVNDAQRLAGVYVGRILQGANLADLPVQQAVRVELVLNSRGTLIPPGLAPRRLALS